MIDKDHFASYKPVCSVCRSVGWSVGRVARQPIGPSVTWPQIANTQPFGRVEGVVTRHKHFEGLLPVNEASREWSCS